MSERVPDEQAEQAEQAEPGEQDEQYEQDEPGEHGRDFESLGLRPELLEALTSLGYEEPTPIQIEAIGPLIDGHDLVGQAATGTGKTAAFALPILQGLDIGRRDADPMALILVPTRELAMQVCEAVHKYGRNLGARVVPIYGGQPIGRQLSVLSRGVDVVVATPGRAIDHIKRGTLRLGEVEVVVLDEADEMLDMGFADELEEILSATPEDRQTVLFSATIPSHIEGIARRHLHDPIQIRISAQPVGLNDAPLLRETAYMVPRSHKPAALGRILDVEVPDAALVFCRTRIEVDELTETLNGRGYRAEALHGGMSQEQRDRVMGRLRSGTADLLIATDVAARGLDVDVLSHVVNYDVPSSSETYVHRVGRVGRAGREGVAITLAEPRQQRLLENIERTTRRRISMAKVPTVDDLRTRRLELTGAAVRDVIENDDVERVRRLVEQLVEDFDLFDVALAAVSLAHDSTGSANDEVEIPDYTDRPRRDRDSDRDRDRDRGSRHDRDRGRPERPRNDDRPRSDDRPRHDDRIRQPEPGMARMFIGAGRQAGIRPGDLVGAITGETRLNGKDVGHIRIGDRFSIVEVPETAIDAVIAALAEATIRGNRYPVRRDRDSR